MPSSTELHRFIAYQESSPELRGTPREAALYAIDRVEAVAYTKGVEAALSRIEMLAAIVPGRISAKEVIRLIGVERDAIIGEWRRKYPQPNLSE